MGGRRPIMEAESLATVGNTLREAAGPSASAEAKPSVNGHWATAARSSGWREATVMEWPPPKELPQTVMRVPSTSRRAFTACDGGIPVGELSLDRQQPAGLAAAVAKVPIGEGQRGDAGLCKTLGEGVQRISRVAPRPCPRMTTGGEVTPVGRYSQAEQVSLPETKETSWRVKGCEVVITGAPPRWSNRSREPAPLRALARRCPRGRAVARRWLPWSAR